MIKIKSFLLILFLLPQFLSSMTSEEFVDWWSSYRSNANIPEELKLMEDYVVSRGLLNQSSNYWNHLNCYNIQQISLYGYQNFKQTVARNYFTWVVNEDNSYACQLKNLVPNPTVFLPQDEINKQHPFFGYQESIQFNLVTQSFLNYILHIGGGPFLEHLEEPLIGNPPYLTYNQRRISQDVFNSLLEFLPVAQHCPVEKIKTVIEVGAGSGRTAFCFLSLLPNIKYVIVDFPAALYVSQTYLSEVFPEKKVMKFRPFENFEEIADLFAEADIIFLTPDQLPKLPNHQADLFLAIDCLHEMKREQVNFYFQEGNRLASYFYFKCWQKTNMPFDQIIYTSDSYPVPSHWTTLLKEPCPIPSDFFHAFYNTENNEL